MIQETTTLWGAIKANALKFCSMATIYLAPIHVMMLLIGVAVIADTVAGRWCARRLAKKAGKDVRLEVTSRRTREGLVSKMLAYQAVIILLFVLDSYMLDDLVQYFLPGFPISYAVTKLVGVILLLVEADSIDEKYYKVTGKRIRDIIQEKIRAIKRFILRTKDFKDEVKGE